MIVKRYNDEHKEMWDLYVAKAKNSHFFFFRNYMEYHSDRFEDFSLLIFDDNDKLISILPANAKNEILYSHQGLTFGGFLIDEKIKTDTMLIIFESVIDYLSNRGFKKIQYKCIPYIYNIKPSDEDKYALFRFNAQLIRRDVSSTIYLSEQIRYSKGRKWMINKAKKENMNISESKDYDEFWKILESSLLNRHGVRPVHSVYEIKRLSELFPDNIKLFIVEKNYKVIAGTVIYENFKIAHTQYLASNEEGKNFGALDLLIDHLIKTKYMNKWFFDFGISNEDNGKYLNAGLIAQKEGFGARAVVQDVYEINLKAQ